MGRQTTGTGEECPCLLRQSDGTLLLKLHVQPRAGRNEIAGLHDGALKLRLTTPPVDGKANKAVLAFLADLFDVPKSSLRLKSGKKSRTKTVIVNGVSREHALKVIGSRLPQDNLCGRKTG